MPEPTVHDRPLLLVEPETVLRRTVALTARTLGLGNVHEAASTTLARQMLQRQAFHGAVIAIDCGEAYDLALLDQVRGGQTASDAAMPIAVLAGRCTPAMLDALRRRDIDRVILKPFRARILLDAFAALAAARPKRD